MSTAMKQSMWSELVALSRNVAPKTQNLKGMRREDEKPEEAFMTPADHAPLWEHESKMAFHLIYEVGDVQAKPYLATRRPYPGNVPYKFDDHFMKHETKQLYDAIIPCSYGLVSFKATGGTEERKEMIRVAKFIWRKGWTVDGVRYRVLYSHLNTDGTMVMVPVKSGITHPKQVGLYISSDRKAPKRVQRVMASYEFMIEAHNPTTYTVSTGEVTVAYLNNGRKISILNVNMDLFNKKETAFLDGHNVANLPMFNGCAGTVFGDSMGMAKGIFASNDRMNGYDFYLYGPKSEIRYTGNKVFIGSLMHTAKHEARLDLQTITNAGFYEDHLATKLGLDIMNTISESIIFGDDEDAVREFVAPFVNASDKARSRKGPDSPEWSAVRMAKMQWESKATSAGFRRIVNTVIKDNCDVSRGKIRVPGALRVYVRPNPLCMLANGLVDFNLDELGTMVREGLKCVSIPDMPERPTLILRNPNTHRNEMELVYNVHLAGLMQYKGQGWCFMGSNAEELLPPLNGADMDDNFVAIQNEEFINKWLSLSYPSQPKDEMKESKSSIRMGRLRDKYETGGSAWTVSSFEKQLKEWEEFTDSLGSFINRGWLDNLLSGEHRPVIGASLTGKTYWKPQDFRPATRAELEGMLPKELHNIIPVDYTPTESNFVAVCTKFNEVKGDYVTAHAMSNSDQVIDWEVMKKGNKLDVERLHAEAKLALRTPYFPMSFANRVPRDRQQAGNYILVETKLCRMLNTLNEYLEGIQEDARQMEHLIKRPLPYQLLNAYPADEGIRILAGQLNAWWIKQINLAKTASKDGLISKHAFKAIAEGKTEALEVKDAAGNIIEVREVHTPGFFDYYTQQFEAIGNGELKLTGVPFSMQTRRKIGVCLINTSYESGQDASLNEDGSTRSVSDGKPSFVWDDIMDSIEEIGIQGSVAFVQLNARLHKAVDVKVIAGYVYNKSNDKLLSTVADPTIPDGNYTMSPSGVIKVASAVDEMLSSYKADLVAARAEGNLLDNDEFAFEE